MRIKKYSWLFLAVLFLAVPLIAQNNTERLEQKISTRFVNTPLERAVRILAQQYGLNVIISGQVRGTVTTSLNDVALGEALDAILKAQGYHYVLGDNVIIVKSLKLPLDGDLETKVFQLKYVDGFHLQTALQPLLSSRGKIEPLLSEPENNEKFQRSNILVVSDLHDQLGKITKVIAAMDQPEKQLQIEVRLVEKFLGGEKKVGLDLPRSATVKMIGAETTAPITKGQGGQSGQQTILSGWYELPNNVQNLNLGILAIDQLKATLDILAQDANSRLIAKPTVSTMNNKKAVIKMGTTIPIPEISRGISGDLFSYKEKDVSMTLEVIPHIGEHGDITLNVHPIMEEIIGYTGPPDAQQPITSRREVNTTVRLKDGETLAIGGLIKENETKTVDKVWLLGDIPILGYLFKHTSVKKQKSDLLIFITTKIINDKS